MKIAVMLHGNQVSDHFGRSNGIVLYDIEDGKILSEELHEAKPHGNGSMPNAVLSLGANVVISGGMGNGAYSKLSKEDVKVFLATEGTAEQAVESFLNGKLNQTSATCGGHSHGHEHDHTCGCSE